MKSSYGCKNNIFDVTAYVDVPSVLMQSLLSSYEHHYVLFVTSVWHNIITCIISLVMAYILNPQSLFRMTNFGYIYYNDLTNGCILAN